MRLTTEENTYGTFSVNFIDSYLDAKKYVLKKAMVVRGKRRGTYRATSSGPVTSGVGLITHGRLTVNVCQVA